MSIQNCSHCAAPVDTDEEEMFQSEGEEVCESCYEEAQEESE